MLVRVLKTFPSDAQLCGAIPSCGGVRMRAQLKRTVLDMIMFHDAQALIYHILYHYVTAR